MRNLLFSFATFAAIIISLFFLCADDPYKAEDKTALNELSIKKSCIVLPISNALNEHRQISEEVKMLMQGEWQIKSITSNKPSDTNYDGQFTTDVYSEMPACALDDVVKFYSDGIVAFQRNERCELTEEDIEKYNWFYSEKENKLNIARGGIEAVMILRSLSGSQFIVDIPMQDGGDYHVFTVTYHHPATGQPLVAMQ